MSKARSRTSAANGRIIIAGTGRAGTTFLVQLFSELGFDTGYSRVKMKNGIDNLSHAGLERRFIDANDNPYVIKSPLFANQIFEALSDHKLDIHAAIIPMRDLFEAAESRRRVYFAALSKGLDPLRQPGSLWMTSKPDSQEDVLAKQFYKTIYPLVKFGIKTILLEFPRLAVDHDYLFRSLGWLLEEHGVNLSEFLQAYRSVARPELISKKIVNGGPVYADFPRYRRVWARSAARALCLRVAFSLLWRFRRWRVPLRSRRSERDPQC